jgi:hypothetical protein
MSRRVQNDEIELGSDSFLDIIANIVGILIILIVIAGVKVSRQPLQASPSVAEVEPVAEAPVAMAPIEEPQPAEPEPAEPPAEPFLRPPPAPFRFVSQKQNPKQPRALFNDSSATKEAQLRTFAIREQKLRTAISQLATLQTQASGAIDSKKAGVTKLNADMVALKKSLEDKQKEIARLRQQLAQADLPSVDVKQIEHKVTPVGKDVSGREVHFRIAKGKVSYVPVDELVEELKQHASRSQSELLRNSTFRGRVGPIRGYRMKYEIARKTSDMGNDLRFGASMFRVVVSEWEVEPTTDLEQETVQQATKPGSLFDRRLSAVESDANVTFWVYPDSFEEYRALQSRVYADGLTVAGRPLPFGVAIAGSPNGTKSSGQ